MLSPLIDKFDQKFLKLQLIPVNQKNKQFYISKMSATQFLELYTTEPVVYDAEKQALFAASFQDDAEYYNHCIGEDKKKIESKNFERKLDPERVSKISTFLNKKEYALFPNSIIVNCELLNNFLNIDPSVAFDNLPEVPKENILCYLELINGCHSLYIPYKKNSILIIDGQHRVRGLEKSKKDHQLDTDNYELILTFILTFNKSTVAELFYTINYTQKSVNKSLLYHLSGEFSKELDEITFMHETVKLLNELEQSPFYKRIKMLGYYPEGVSFAQKEMMTISQAFLIDYLVNTILKDSSSSIQQPIFLFYFNNKDLQIEIIRFIIKYFNAVKHATGQAWDDPANSVISKTVSVGALIKVLQFLFVKIFIDEFKYDPKKMKDISATTIGNRLKGIELTDLSNSGEFGGVGSAGSLNKLKKQLLVNIEYFGAQNYNDFIKSFKQDYISKFKVWLSKNT